MVSLGVSIHTHTEQTGCAGLERSWDDLGGPRFGVGYVRGTFIKFPLTTLPWGEFRNPMATVPPTRPAQDSPRMPRSTGPWRVRVPPGGPAPGLGLGPGLGLT